MVDLLTTPITIEVGELSSATATDQPVIASNGDEVLNAGDFIDINATSLGSGGFGLSVQLEFTYPV